MHVLQAVLGSVNFKEAVREYSYDGNVGFHFRRDAEGNWIDKYHTPEEVYDKIMLENTEDIGYTYPGDKTIYTYRNRIRGFNAIGYASHLVHEWCHKLGFTHDFERSENRENSVPYAIGNMVGKLYSELHIIDSNGFQILSKIKIDS